MRQALVTLLVLITTPVLASQPTPDKSMIERGRYISQIGGCNDCHTPGYMDSNGATPESQWLIGDTLGWQGPWGTTYAPNLRLFLKDKTEDEWVKEAKSLRRRPPMPWYNVNVLDEKDLRALYQFVKSLGDPGKQTPAAVPPGQKVSPPYMQLVLPPMPQPAQKKP